MRKGYRESTLAFFNKYRWFRTTIRPRLHNWARVLRLRTVATEIVRPFATPAFYRETKSSSRLDTLITRRSLGYGRDALKRRVPVHVLPNILRIITLDGVCLRTFEMRPHRQPSTQLAFSIEQGTASQVVIPIFVPGSCPRSITIGVHGILREGCSIRLSLAASIDGLPLVEGLAWHDPGKHELIWPIVCSPIEAQGLYFLRISANQPSGLHLPCREWAVVSPGDIPELKRLSFAPLLSLPLDWTSSSQARKRTIAALVSSQDLHLLSRASLNRGLATQFAKADVRFIKIGRTDLDAVNDATSSEAVFIPKDLFGRSALGLSTTDLIHLLKLQDTDVIGYDPAPPATASNIASEQITKERAEDSNRELGGELTPSIAVIDPLIAKLNSLPHTSRPSHVAVITILHRKTATLLQFLNAIYVQSYPGPITVVIVGNAAEIVTAIEGTRGRQPPNIAISIVQDCGNLSLSRNAAIKACDADVYAFVDSRCYINGDFVRAHVAEHLLARPDAVVSPYWFGTEGGEDLPSLACSETQYSDAILMGRLPDPLLPAAYVNLGTSGCSLSKLSIEKYGLFDPAFNYGAEPDLGYNWSDVDFGARIYASGGAIRFTSRAISIYPTHLPDCDGGARTLEAANNLLRLIAKHPFISTVSRRWFVDTADRIIHAAAAATPFSPEISALKAMIELPKARMAPLLPYFQNRKRRYRIVTHRWHVAHQYEIYKLPFDFTLLTDTGTRLTDQWDYQSRPLPENVRLMSRKEIDQSDFDLAIIHFDENVLCTELSNNVLDADWGDTFRWFLENIKLPVIAVCHGTVPFVGQYGANPNPIATFKLYETEAHRLRKKLANAIVVVNSYEAAREWKFDRMKVIWHGYDPQEFPIGSHDLDVISHGLDRNRPHYRGAHQLKDVLSRLDPRFSTSTHEHVRDVPVATIDPRYADFSFKRWLIHLGRHKIYLNTTLRSPMPRARTEAMLCGTIPVSLDNHDVSRFIQPGINGYYSSSTGELADFCNAVCNNEGLREKLSASARQTAIDLFNHDRFLTEWIQLIEDTLDVGSSLSF
jgi:glycosyltransferase involved in cell wall biosynthesis